MHRLLVDSAILGMGCVVLGKDNAAHLKVLRPKDGEEIELFDGCGSVRTYKWESSSRTLLASAEKRTFPRGSTSAPLPNPSQPSQLALFTCITKGQRWDWTLQKATELGVARIIPVISARTIVRIAPGERAAKRERWMKICEEAARQSDAVWLPEISEPLDFATAVAEAAKTECFVGALTSPPPQPLLAAIQETLAMRGADGGKREFSAFIGPEGDFTPDELASLLEIATPANFGPTILRAETAAIFAISVLAATLHRRYIDNFHKQKIKP